MIATSADQLHMERALRLAAQGRGRTSPNPMVGAVVVSQGRVVGEGYHRRAGEDHAEVVALKQAGPRARGATLYVSLEPCCHVGRTPPCTDLIVRMGVERVMASMVDPNPLVSGRGFALLQGAGVQVEWGLMEREVRRLNEAYLKYIATGLPLVILKGAMSLDGKIADSTRESKWITGEEARERVHRLRDEVDAIMVGIGTVLQDDPQLTTRLPSRAGKDPLRVVLDPHAQLPRTARMIHCSSQSKTLLIASPTCPPEKLEELRKVGVEIWTMGEGEGRIRLLPLLRRLAESQVTSLMIEGGSEVNASALEEGIVDKVILFVAPRFLGGREAPSLVGGRGMGLRESLRLKNVSLEWAGDDIIIQGYLHDPAEV